MNKTEPYLNYILFWLAVPIGVVFSGCLGVEAEESHHNSFATSFFDHITNDSFAKFKLSFDLGSLFNHIEDEEKVPALLTLDGQDEPLPIHIASRGVTRKKICTFPPLRLRLKKDLLQKSQWSNYKKYKMVTHCFFENTEHDQVLLREFLIYKLYERLTPKSFRSQLVNVEYQLKQDTISHFAFILENEDEMEDRLGYKKFKEKEVAIENIPLEFYQKYVLFQYMIGNTDWNLSGRHNIKVLRDEKDSLWIIPYDFDYCGLVNADYATPHANLPIKDVRERLFQYRGHASDDFTNALQVFRDVKEDFLSLIHDFPYLHEESKELLTKYIESFYSIIEDPDWKTMAYSNLN